MTDTDRDKVLQQVGRITLAWSLIELRLKYAIAPLLELDPLNAQYLTADLTGYQLIDRLRAITDHLPEAQARTLTTVINQVDELRNRRNEVAHHTLLRDWGLETFRFTARNTRQHKGPRVYGGQMPYGDLRALADQMDSAAAEVHDTLTALSGRPSGWIPNEWADPRLTAGVEATPTEGS